MGEGLGSGGRRPRRQPVPKGAKADSLSETKDDKEKDKERERGSFKREGSRKRKQACNERRTTADKGEGSNDM
jgi:hypothetical protein